MKICIDLTSLDDNFSGIERYAACLTLEMLDLTNDDFILVFKNRIPEMFSKIKKKNVEIIILGGCDKLVFYQIRLPLALLKIQADYFLFLAFPVPVFLFRRNMVSTIHDICCWDCPETMNRMSKWYFRISHRIAIHKCKFLITISEFSKHRIMEKLKVSEKRILLIYCGISSKLTISNGINEGCIRKKYNIGRKYILSLSTLEPRKNLKLLISAYQELIKEGYNLPELVLAGRRGWKINEVLPFVEDDIRNRIIFTGFIDDEDLSSLYSNALCFIFPSIYEGFGLPPLEAMSCGVPVIASDSSSLPEICGNAALYFKSGSKTELKKKILQIINADSTAIQNMKRLGFNQASRFQWKNEARKLLENIKK